MAGVPLFLNNLDRKVAAEYLCEIIHAKIGKKTIAMVELFGGADSQTAIGVLRFADLDSRDSALNALKDLFINRRKVVVSALYDRLLENKEPFDVHFSEITDAVEKSSTPVNDKIDAETLKAIEESEKEERQKQKDISEREKKEKEARESRKRLERETKEREEKERTAKDFDLELKKAKLRAEEVMKQKEQQEKELKEKEEAEKRERERKERERELKLKRDLDQKEKERRAQEQREREEKARRDTEESERQRKELEKEREFQEREREEREVAIKEKLRAEREQAERFLNSSEKNKKKEGASVEKNARKRLFEEDTEEKEEDPFSSERQDPLVVKRGYSNLSQRKRLLLEPEEMPEERWGHHTLLTFESEEPRMLLYGGENDTQTFGDVWSYGLRDAKWKRREIVNSPSARTFFASTTICDDKKVLIYGGRQAQQYWNDVLLLDLTQDAWIRVETCGSRPPPLAGATLTAVNDKAFLFGGSHELWRSACKNYQMRTFEHHYFNELSVLTLPPSESVNSTFAVGDVVQVKFGKGWQDAQVNDLTLGNGKIRYLVQALEGDGGEGELEWISYSPDRILSANEPWTWYQPSVYEYSSSSSSSSLSLGLPSPRGYHSTNFIPYKNSLIVFGGKDAVGCYNDVHFFDINKNQWIESRHAASSPTGIPSVRCGHAAFAVNDRVLGVMGGWDLEKSFSDVWYFDTVSEEWICNKEMRAFPPRVGHDAVYWEKCAFVFGGGQEVCQTDGQTGVKYVNDFLLMENIF